jgi:hypothetical protein
MAAAANAEWGGLMAVRRCEAYAGQTSRKIFLREMGRRIKEEIWLLGL